jgi:hypothetical protein
MGYGVRDRGAADVDEPVLAQQPGDAAADEKVNAVEIGLEDGTMS